MLLINPAITSSRSRPTLPRTSRLTAQASKRHHTIYQHHAFFDTLSIVPILPKQKTHEKQFFHPSNMWANTSSSNPASPTTHAPPPPSYKMKHQGKRIAQIVKLKPECVEEYKKCHAKVWPEVLKQIRECSIEDCTSFLLRLTPPTT
jgi:hypothetical protein